jgi:phosphonate degradation associated HDIG domain protein
MYAFRKPFTAATFSGLHFFGTTLDLKTAFVISQIIGYTLSKYVGIKVCSEATPGRRVWLLVGLILWAEAALLLFAVAPPSLQVVAMFLNGFPLGMVWGLVVWYLEGRRTSELLLAALSCSFIVSSGVVKDVGRWLMVSQGVSEAWMPFTAGLLFLPLFFASVWFLNQLPPPNAADEAARVRRTPMDAGQRRRFIRRFFLGLSLLIVSYLFLTAYRDFRDNYGAELFGELGYHGQGLFSRTELPVAFIVMGAMALLNVIKDNRLGLLGAFGLAIGGLLLTGAATLLLDLEWIGGLAWMILVGLGAYLAYVPFNSMLFDRLMAWTRAGGTAVFTIYLADAAGYTGSVGVQLYKDLAQTNTTRLDFFRAFTYALSLLGATLLAASCWIFTRRSVNNSSPDSPGANVSAKSFCESIVQLFHDHGDAAYLGESVSQTEHALQTAWAAEQAHAEPALIAASLLHDVGHLLHHQPEDCAKAGIDGRHEELGARWLERFFGPEVTQTIRLHVPAKRYLCAVDPNYLGRLSEASLLSLQVQGGPFTEKEAQDFIRDPHAETALALRRFDEAAKIKGLPTPGLEHFLPYVEAVLGKQK